MIKILLIFLLISSPVFASGWYSTLQGTASDVEQDIPSDGVILQWSSFYQKWLFAYGVAPSGGTTGQVLTKNSGSNYDYSWTTPSGGGTSWLANGNNIYSPNSGNVGIGTSVPMFKLDVSNIGSANGKLAIQPTAGTSSSNITYGMPIAQISDASWTNIFADTHANGQIANFLTSDRSQGNFYISDGLGQTAASGLLMGFGRATPQPQDVYFQAGAYPGNFYFFDGGGSYTNNDYMGNLYTQQAYTLNNTLDDGSGNMSLAGGAVTIGPSNFNQIGFPTANGNIYFGTFGYGPSSATAGFSIPNYVVFAFSALAPRVGFGGQFQWIGNEPQALQDLWPTENIPAINISSVGVITSGNVIQIGNTSYAGTVYKVDYAGNETANSFIKSGGTSSQSLCADGSAGNCGSYLTSISPITLSGSNVGIGSATPGSKLDVQGTVRVLGSGNVGIGSASPGQKLDVQGTVRSSLGFTVGGSCTTLYKCVGGVDAGVIQTSACNLCPAGSCTALNGCF
jgi:hypothetical protein